MSKTKKTKVDREVEEQFVNSMPPIEELSVDVIKPYENNPRFNEDAIPKVAASIRDFGWQQPIVIDKNNVIVAGHTRYLAALSLKYKHVPCVRASKLTPEQIRAYRLVDNKTNELATWDDMKLDEELDALPQFDFKEYGFNYGAEAEGDILDGFDSDSDEEVEGAFDIDKSKVSFTIPREHIKQVQAYIKSNGSDVFVDFILKTCGCVTEELEEERDAVANQEAADQFAADAEGEE